MLTYSQFLIITNVKTYVCSYFTKDETERSEAITNAAKEVRQVLPSSPLGKSVGRNVFIGACQNFG